MVGDGYMPQPRCFMTTAKFTQRVAIGGQQAHETLHMQVNGEAPQTPCNCVHCSCSDILD